MIYMTFSELQGGYPLPPGEWLSLVMKGMEQVMRYKKQGKVLFHAAPVGRQAGYMIWDVASNEELQFLLTQLPFWPFLDWDVVPLVSTEEVMKSLKQSMEATQAENR